MTAAALFVSFRTMNTAKESVDDAIYKKCMHLAREYAENKTCELKKKYNLNENSFIIFNPWVDLWKQYGKKKVTEEDVKFCFLSYFVPEYYFSNSGGDVTKMKKSQLLRQARKIKVCDFYQNDYAFC